MYSSFYRIFKYNFITLCSAQVVYYGAPVLRVSGALANDMIWYDFCRLTNLHFGACDAWDQFVSQSDTSGSTIHWPWRHWAAAANDDDNDAVNQWKMLPDAVLWVGGVGSSKRHFKMGFGVTGIYTAWAKK